MKYEIISSSSKGNCIIIDDFFALDIGVSFSKIKPFLKNIKLVFVSHTHSDHLLKSTVKKVAYEKPNIKFICGNEDVLNNVIACGIAKQNAYILENYKWYDMGKIKVSVEPLSHDIPNNLLKWEIDGKKAIYFVDTSNVDNVVANNYDYFFVESNYDEEEIEQRAIDETLRVRIRNSHLSKQKCDEFLMNNMSDNSVCVYCHKHEEREIDYDY